MPYYMIHGHPNCPNFAHAIVVAEYLSKRLPSFKFRKVEVAPKEWGEHLMEINKHTKWFIVRSPLIWKEIHHWGGKKYLIGGLGEFWEYVYCYYGLESRIPKTELRKLVAENMTFFEEREYNAVQRKNYVRIISLIGASNLITILMLKDLFEIDTLKKKEGIMVKLYDEHSNDQRKRKIMEDTATYYNSQNIFGSSQAVVIVETLKETVEDCDLLIIIEDFRRHQGQNESSTLQKCFARMNCLSEVICESRHRGMRIVIANEGPSCFLATCLVEFCPNLRPSDIVVVTGDEALPYVKVMSEKTGILVADISAPPVWGFTGMNCFVDVKHTVFKTDVYRPNMRSLTAPLGSTLPLGTIKSELRLMSYLITSQDEIVRVVQSRKKKVSTTLERPPFLGKIRSLASLLKLWYAEDPTDEIVSVGVCSNGSFDIPPGVVFSQPVILDSKHRWVPYTGFPLMDETTRKEIKQRVETSSKTLKEFGLLHHFCKEDMEICSNPDCQLRTENCLIEGSM